MSGGIAFTSLAWADYLHWQGQDKKTLKRINLLIDAARRDPFAGIGKPEPLLGQLSGYGSRASMMFSDWFMPWTMWI